MKAKGAKPQLQITILSNIVINQLADILDFWLRKHDITTSINIGNYDNIVQDAASIPRDEVVIVFWEAANINDGFHYLIKNLDAKDIEAYTEKVKGELDMVFSALSNHKKVFFNSFHALPFELGAVPGNYQLFVAALNVIIEKEYPENFQCIDVPKLILKTGLDQSFDLRNFFSSKALYTIDFFKTYSAALTPMIAALTGNVKKVLAVDCDNTLWKGIIGEDGKEGIKITPPYLMVQASIVELYKRGVLVCLCSKNNPADVEEILEQHPKMILRNEHLLLKKVNWEDKIANLRAIGQELNLGLSSFVFLDDSSFEVNLVREQLPEVTVFQVPEKAVQYPVLMEEIAHQFFQFDGGSTSSDKTAQYKVQAQREEAKASYHSIEDYLRSLDLAIRVEKNNEAHIPRMAQMTQKTNQFNVTTKRYSEQDIKSMMDSSLYDFYTLSVSDRFGDSGITALAVLKNGEVESEIDTFLLSCRILGRNIEWVFIDQVLADAHTSVVGARFIPSRRNQQVAALFDRLGFELVRSNKEGKEYKINISAYKAHHNIDYIKVNTWKNE